MIPAFRRFGWLLVGISAGTAGISAVLGLLLGASLTRSVSIGFYAIGSLLMLGGFFVGNRGPARVKEPDTGQSSGLGQLSITSRRLRWATGTEQHEAINMSAVFVTLGFVLILFGIASDTRHSLF